MADLITINEYKDHEGLRGEKDDDRLNVIIPQVSDLAKKYCGTTFIDFYSSSKTETFNIRDVNTSVIIVSETPLVNVSSVGERDNPSVSYTTLTEGTDYFVDTASDAIFRLNVDGLEKAYKKGFAAVTVTYTAGFASTPNDLKLALFDLVNYYLRDEWKERRTLGGAQIQQQGTSDLRNSTDFPDHIKRVLDLYRVVI